MWPNLSKKRAERGAKVFLLLLVGIFTFFGLFPTKLRPAQIFRAYPPTPTSMPDPIKFTQTVKLNQQTYAYTFWSTRNTDKLQLIYNLDDKSTSSEIFEKNRCLFGVSGGFYTPDFKPLGLFITGKQIYQPRKVSSLLNGFLAIDESAKISSEPPISEPRIVLQTGPRLIAASRPLTLAIKNDDPARRMVAAVSQSGSLVFLGVFDPENTFAGPKLAELAEIVKLVSDKEALDLVSAINLDGGSASSIKTELLQLSELTPVGSFFCLSE